MQMFSKKKQISALVGGKRKLARHHLLGYVAKVLLIGSVSGIADAAPFVDPVGDFIPSYTAGPRSGDLDVITSEVTFSGTQFVFTSTFAGPVGTTAGSLYVLGFDRGRGTARFPAIAPGVLFDEVLSVTGTGIATVRDLSSGAATVLPASAVNISGNNLNVAIPAQLLPSQGFAQESYTWNLWPRVGAGNDNQISDFAPNNSNVTVTFLSSTSVPEPSSIAIFGLGMLSVFFARHKTA